MKIKNKVLVVFLAIVAVAALFWILSIPKGVEGTTDRQNYNLGDALEIEIKNNLGAQVCFSSCYPYLIEWKNKDGLWEQYSYDDCGEADIAADCVPANGTKRFRLPLLDMETGLNRLKIPVCVDCSEGREFAQESVLYSNEFQVD